MCRCADYILKEFTNCSVRSIFLTAPMEYRIRQTMEIDKLSEKTATDKIRKEDKVRSVYYNFYTGHDWGKPSDYNYCINTVENREAEPHLYNIKWCLSSSGSKRPYCSGQILFKFSLPPRQKAAITYKQFRRSVI